MELQPELRETRAESFFPDDAKDLLICPGCRGDLSWSATRARCASCKRDYPIVDGIPVLLLDVKLAEHDELDHHHGAAHVNGQKQGQMEFFDSAVSREFEIMRPHGTPALYRWHYETKFRKSITGLESVLAGATVLTVCGGSGMDAEYLASRAARVITSDISLGATKRARERARRFNLALTPIVADVERLPFRSRSVDLAYVHDGLHHLERPLRGLAEMIRVAARAVSVTEPAEAFATAVAVRLGLALEREEAGNVVARLRPANVVREITRNGFEIVNIERYAMYHKHEPGRLIWALSLPGIFPLSAATVRFANLIVGRWGNRLTVGAVRAGSRS